MNFVLLHIYCCNITISDNINQNGFQYILSLLNLELFMAINVCNSGIILDSYGHYLFLFKTITFTIIFHTKFNRPYFLGTFNVILMSCHGQYMTSIPISNEHQTTHMVCKSWSLLILSF